MGRLTNFALLFFGSVPARSQVMAALYVLAVSLTEGAGIALLAPLLALLADQGESSWIQAGVARVFTGAGLPLNLPVLLAIFLGVVTAGQPACGGETLCLPNSTGTSITRYGAVYSTR